MNTEKITICILSKNSDQTISRALDSVRSFREVILLDNGSTDDTLSVAKTYPNVRIFSHSFIGFGPLRNLAADHATSDWIFALDTDEVLSQELLNDLLTLDLSKPNLVYSMPRRNFYNGKWIRGCGWHPDRVIRCYHRQSTKFSETQVHESIETAYVSTVSLQSHLIHTPFRSTSEFLAKMQHYSSLFASEHAKQRKSSLTRAFFHSLFAFFRSFFFQKGFLLGAEGFIVSLYNSNTTFYKYLKLWEKK